MRVNQQENKIALLSQEISRLNDILSNKTDEIDQLQNRLQIHQKEHGLMMGMINKYQLQIRKFDEERFAFKQQISDLGYRDSRVSDYENEIRKLVSHLTQYKTRIELLSQQIQRLKNLLYSKSTQLDQYQKKEKILIFEIERLNNVLRQKCQKLFHSENVHQELILRINSLEEINTNMTESPNMKKQFAEFERLQTIIRDLNKQNYNLKVQHQDSEQLQNKNYILSAEIDRLTGIIQSQSKQIKDLKLFMADESTVHSGVVLQQIESLIQKVKQKQRQAQNVRKP